MTFKASDEDARPQARVPGTAARSALACRSRSTPVFVSQTDSSCALAFPGLLFFGRLFPFRNNVTDLERK